jgi:hypothetical protein
MNRIAAVVVTCLLFPLPSAHSQQMNVFAPFASRLETQREDSTVVLAWRDSPDLADGTYLVYRHTERIDSANVDEAELLAAVDAGVQTYTDTPLSAGTYYYAVIAQDSDGNRYDVFVPYRNVTASGLVLETVATEQDLAARVTNLSAQVQEDYIVINFDASKIDRDLILFRATSPIRSAADLFDATSLGTFESTLDEVEDYPVPGIPYYYAMSDAALVKIGRIHFVPQENATTTPVQVPVSTNRIGLPETIAPRSLPLPFLMLTSEIETGDRLGAAPFTLPQYRTASKRTAQSVQSLLETLPPIRTKAPEPVILPEDRGEGSGGEAYTLRSVLQNEFQAREWDESVGQLLSFLSIRRSDELEARGRFYLGQAYYFQGRHREAFFEFLLAEDYFYTQVQPWLAALYDKLAEEQ